MKVSRAFRLFCLFLIGLGLSLSLSSCNDARTNIFSDSATPSAAESSVPIGCKSPVDNFSVIYPLENGMCRQGETVVYGNRLPNPSANSPPIASEPPVQQMPPAQYADPVPPQVAPQGQTRLHVDLSERQVHVYRGNTYVASFEVGGGLDRSPIGQFSVIQKELPLEYLSQSGKTYDWISVMGAPEWIGIHQAPEGIYGFHGPEDGLYEGGLGCFRMNPADLRQLYNMVELGTPVTVTP